MLRTGRQIRRSGIGTDCNGDGCARPNSPGVYARISDRVLREYIRSLAPAGVADAATGGGASPAQSFDPAKYDLRTAPAPEPGKVAA